MRTRREKKGREAPRPENKNDSHVSGICFLQVWIDGTRVSASPIVGIEPTATGLKVLRSTAELYRLHVQREEFTIYKPILFSQYYRASLSVHSDPDARV